MYKDAARGQGFYSLCILSTSVSQRSFTLTFTFPFQMLYIYVVLTARIYIALGSNIEPRRAYLEQARLFLHRISEGGWQESSVMETQAIGPAGQGAYLNQVVSFLSRRNALQLLHYCKGVELLLGRKERGRWEEREIDLDLLYRGNEIIRKSPSLILPHPRISERLFVLDCLYEIAPEWRDPWTLTTVRNMRQQLRTQHPRLP